ncbi:hypothetical protein [Fulvimonas soli]|jgi:hypothetical protein|uniref:Uncharacterized protein n=1 Tax=Fulvimonas soli TaxID=155197 RepID=A0A316IH87_9GAMM|nr:hypothetical protein [Fulvimonas soli]PWK92741.1 hypothetical protein C7456_10173 [Fulvimonas soli]TNY25880.1 hypothetical protein BV497_11515 [Fulvimonas soli]
MTPAFHRRLLCLAALGAAGVCGAARAQPPPVPLPSPSARPALPGAPVSDAVLDGVRGGYDVGQGLVASLGVARAVYVNGSLVTSTRFSVPDIAHLTAPQAAALASALGAVNLVQIGANNSFDPSLLRGGLGATVIQNTLDRQAIQGLTTLDVTVNTLGAFRAQSLQDSLQAAQLGSLGH